MTPNKRFFHFDWIIAQRWSDLVFLNYSIDPLDLQKRLPLGMQLDTFDGKAFLSIVPFMMSGVRFPFTPRLPFSSLLELNIRTYVTVNGVPGIYFFTLDTDHRLAALIARFFFHLPYRHQKLEACFRENSYFFKSPEIELKGIIKEPMVKDSFAQWITERYSLFTNKGERTLYRGVAMHQPWQLAQFDIEVLKQSFLKNFNFDQSLFENAYYARPLEVRFRPFTRIEGT